MIINGKRLAKPIFQGGMGVGISLGGLAGAVAKAGGAGTISAAQIGFREEDFESNPMEANLRAMDKEMKKAREISPDGIIGFNIMVAMRGYEDYVRQAVRIGADFIVSGAGLPMELVKLVKSEQADSSLALIPVVSTERAAKVILKGWSKKYDYIPDMLLVEGPKAGGHLGFSNQQLEEYKEDIYGEEVKKIILLCKEYEKEYQKKISVILAGGISKAEDVKKAFLLGAEAVQSASRFVTTYECDASERFKEAYLNAKKEDVILVKSPVGMMGRALSNHFTDEVMKGKQIKAKHCKGCLKSCHPNEAIYCISEALIRSVSGDVENGLVFCGANVHCSNHMESVESVIKSLLS